MAQLAKLKPGQILWTVSRRRMGNTTLQTTSIHTVRVVEVHADHVIASWNENMPEKFYMRSVAAWKLKKPLTVTGAFGSTRLMTGDERRAAEVMDKVNESRKGMVN